MGYPKLAHHRFPPNGTGSPGSAPLSGASRWLATATAKPTPDGALSAKVGLSLLLLTQLGF
jgi:hypothetical protein